MNYRYNNTNVIAILTCKDSMKYFKDICTTFKALSEKSLKGQYEIIYDAVCNYLDNEFIQKNLCGFCNDVCIASRLHQLMLH